MLEVKNKTKQIQLSLIVMSNNVMGKIARLSKESNLELKSEKVELALGDEAKALISKLKSASDETNSELDSAFTPIRQLENAIKRFTGEIPSKINKFKPFMKALTDLEAQFDKDRSKLKNAEQELGVKIPEPKIFNTVSKELSFYQGEEEAFRKEINEFNSLAKKFKSIS